jgi:DNA-binding response OmpR family regulator
MAEPGNDQRYAQLIALDIEVAPAKFTLSAASCTIGRAPSSDLVVRHNLVSRLHATVERRGPRYVLADADSANGTFVNGRRITAPHQLRRDDRIGLGSPTPLLCFFDPDPTAVGRPRLEYDEHTMRFTLGQRQLDLTRTQLLLLLYLYRHAGEVCSREACAAAAWGREYDGGMDAKPLDELLSKLRSKLRAAAPDTELLTTRRGLGFMLEP